MRRFVFAWLGCALLGGLYCLAVAVAPAVAGAMIVAIVRPAVVAAAGGWTWPIADSVLRLEFDAEVDPQPDTSEDGTHSFATMDGSANEPTWMADGSMWFDGVNDWMFGDAESLQVGGSSITFAAWAFIETTNTAYIQAKWGTTANGNKREYAWGTESSNGLCAMQLLMCSNGQWDSGLAGYAVSAYCIPTGAWVYLVAQRDGTNALFFTNGAALPAAEWKLGTTNFPTYCEPQTYTNTLGCNYSTNGVIDTLFAGYLDENSMWPTLLSADTQADIFTNQKAAHP